MIQVESYCELFSLKKMRLGRIYLLCKLVIVVLENHLRIAVKPYLDGVNKPNTALELMRSRYSAYATGSADYILRTTHISTRNLYDLDSILNWSTTSKWLRLQIVTTKKGMPKIQKDLSNSKQPIKPRIRK